MMLADSTKKVPKWVLAFGGHPNERDMDLAQLRERLTPYAERRVALPSAAHSAYAA
jgi:hypothetical protein